MAESQETDSCPANTPLGALVSRFLEHLRHEKKQSERTIAHRRTDLFEFVRFVAAENGDAATIELADKLCLRRWLADVSKRVKPHTMAQKLGAVRVFFNFLVELEIVRGNPTDLIARPKLRSNLPSVPSAEEMAQVLDAPLARRKKKYTEAELARDQVIQELLYGCGLRVTEASGLDLDSINMTTRTLRVLGKGNKEREVPFGEKVMGALEMYLPLRQSLAHPKTAFLAAGALLLSARGRRLVPNRIREIVRDHSVAATGKPQHPHLSRHACATHMLDGGAGLRDIQEFLGHSSLATTQRYTQVSTAQLTLVYDEAHPMAIRPRPSEAK